MKQAIKTIGFSLIIIGTVGLLVTEFAVDGGRPYTLTFAAINVVGLATLAIDHWTIRSE
jgi:hypothetical protein